MHYEICGKQVRIVRLDVNKEHVHYGWSSQLFRAWVDSLDPRFGVTNIEVQAVDFRGNPSKDSVMFMRFRVTATSAPFPQVVELRGGTSVMLPILRCEGREFTVLVQQPRLATGNYSLPEIPAGMIEGGTFGGAAARELEEELGLVFTEDELVELTRGEGIYFSPGLLDEQARFYVAERAVSVPELEGLRGKITGAAGEGERITLRAIPLSELITATRDAKTFIALALYNAYKSG